MLSARGRAAWGRDDRLFIAAGRLVRWHRERCVWTQAELATRLGTSAAAVSQIEHGRAGQSLVALALFVLGAHRAGALVAAIPRGEYARAAAVEARRLARGERRRLRLHQRIELDPRIEAAARSEISQRAH